jgi:hypothetical protein
MHTSSCKFCSLGTLLVLTSACILSTMESEALAQWVNPSTAPIFVGYRTVKGGPIRERIYAIRDAQYLANVLGGTWCSHFTHGGIRKFDHAHISNADQYPITIDGMSVTCEMVNWYYDPQFWGYTRYGDPDMKYNCHGHAFGVRDILIYSGMWGIAMYRADLGCPTYSYFPYCAVAWSASYQEDYCHSYWVESIYSAGCPGSGGVNSERTVTEKESTSGLYTITYPNPGTRTTDPEAQYYDIYWLHTKL